MKDNIFQHIDIVEAKIIISSIYSEVWNMSMIRYDNNKNSQYKYQYKYLSPHPTPYVTIRVCPWKTITHMIKIVNFLLLLF